MAKGIADRLKDVRIFIDDAELRDKDRINLLRAILIDKKASAKKLILNRYFLGMVLAFCNGLLHSRQKDDLYDYVLNEILFEFGFKKAKRIRLQDKIMILQTENKDGLNFRNCRELGISYRESILSNQYNIFPENIKGRIVIDGGSNLGEFAVYCAKLGAKKVYAFEPVTKTYGLLVNNIRLNKLGLKVIPVKKALGDSNEKMNIYFNQIGDSGASINLGGHGINSEIIKLAKLDDFIKKSEKIGFIKLDVEGYEENALKGASKIIKRDKPILAFSAYHRPADKTRLPAVVRSIRPDYKIKLLKRDEDEFYCE